MGLFKKKKIVTETVSNDKVKSQETQKDYWECPKCATHNLLTSRSCKDCGYYR